MKPILKTIIWLSAFSISMGYLESAVVVYLRAIYYPYGFNFPLKVIDHKIAITEFWREMATLIMLFGVGRLTGKNPAQRFAFFIYNFAVWDICYYLFLKLLLNWPQSLLTWDILFLIPVPWVGPVIVPCILSLSMILFSILILFFNLNGLDGRMARPERRLIILGCIISIISCIEDYILNLYTHHELGAMFNILNPNNQAQLFADFGAYVPKSFDWLLFCIGEIFILSSIILYFIRNNRSLVQYNKNTETLNYN